MENLNLIIKSSQDGTYVVVGESFDATTEPEEWYLPTVPNEYGTLNAKEVVKSYLSDLFSTNDIDINSTVEGSRVINLETTQHTFRQKVIQVEEDDPEDVFEHRRFIDSFAFSKILKKHIYVEPSTESVKPYLVEYLHILIAKAKELNEHELLFGEGLHISSDICGSIGWQDADGIENNGWLKSETVLVNLLNVSGVLDYDTNNRDKWRELFDIADELKV